MPMTATTVFAYGAQNDSYNRMSMHQLREPKRISDGATHLLHEPKRISDEAAHLLHGPKRISDEATHQLHGPKRISDESKLFIFTIK